MHTTPTLAPARHAFALGFAFACAACSGGAPPESPAPGQVQVGYGTVEEGMGTGAVASLTEEGIKRRRVLHVEDLLEGMAGVHVMRSGSSFTLNVRNPGSTEGVEPLVVIDGIAVPEGSVALAFSGLAVQDIARIDVIKDGMSAIYGRRGGNGVILVTTKR